MVGDFELGLTRRETSMFKSWTYRASQHVRLGVPDEHAYNMFLSVMEQCHRLGLWTDHISWIKSQQAFYRLTETMKIGRIQGKHHVQSRLEKKKPYSSGGTKDDI